jgi:hypothetical protein
MLRGKITQIPPQARILMLSSPSPRRRPRSPGLSGSMRIIGRSPEVHSIAWEFLEQQAVLEVAGGREGRG